MAGAHHDAAEHHQGGGREPELLCAEHRGNDHVAPGLELPVGLQPDPAAEAVHHQGLLGLGQAELPGRAGMAYRRKGRGSGAAVVTADEDHVRFGLDHAGRNRAHAHLGDQLHRDTSLGVGAAEVVNQLLDVLDGVDIVVRRRRDQADVRGGVPGLRDPGIDLLTGELSAFARFGSLGDLDLQLARVDEILGRHAEAPAGDLLHGAAAAVSAGQGHVAGRVFASLPAVAHTAQAVHGDGQGFVGLLADGTEGHRSRNEALDDLGLRFYLI